MPCDTATSAPLGTASAPTPEDRPRIYVACLAAYNNGYLHGRWINATTPDEIMGKVRAMLADSPLPDADEWAIHDYEGFEGASLSEYASFETVMGRDMELNGDIFTVETGFDQVHIFWSR